MASAAIKVGGKRREVDMTQGSIFRHLLSFALPLLAGNIFQQLYNMVDTWVVGNFVSNEAFSAVGTVGPIINMLIGIFMGLSSGSSTVIAQYFGAKKYDRVQDGAHTAVLLALILGVAFTFIGIGMTPFMLGIMKTPDEVLPEATRYLTIYFSGILSMGIYNMGAGILRGVGDSRRPFYFLVVSACSNIVLDLVFVLVFKMGVEGVALATVIAQSASAVLVLVVLLRNSGCVRIFPRKLMIHMELLKKILKVGFPAALQMAVTSFSNVFVQSYINFFGSNFMSGWTAYAKIDQLLILPMQSISIADTTFVGQNLGAGQVKRARRGVNTALAMAVCCSLLLMIPVMLFAPYLVAFFNSKPEVVTFGAMLLRWLSPFYVLCCVNQICAGALRGAGNSRTPMFIMLGSFVVFRQCYLYVMAHYICNEVLPIAMAYPAGWLVCSTIMLIYYKHTNLEKTTLVAEQPKATE